MDMVTYAGPNPGDAKAGNLYADLGSRTLWLGVEAAVDPAQAVLISDIVGMQADIDQTLLDANAYTDQKLTAYAKLNGPVFTGNLRGPWPTADPTSIPTTEWVRQAVAAYGSTSGFIRGMIMTYYGQLSEIGVGGLAGWALCDGSNGTPDLRDKFILGAGSRVPGSANAPSMTTTTAGGHDHTVNGVALSIAEMPSHDHSPGTGGQSANHTHSFSGATAGRNAAHTHGPSTLLNANGGGTRVGGLTTGSGVFYRASDTESADHAHAFSGNTAIESATHTHAIYFQGGGQAHTHTLVGGGGAHAHTITAAQLREAIPFFALAFIMKL